MGQLLGLLNKPEIRHLSKSGGYDRYVKKLDGYTHLVILLYAVLMGFDSIREIVIGMLAEARKLKHLGIDYMVRRSTLADANNRRSSRFFEDVYRMLYERYKKRLGLVSGAHSWESKLYVMDSTTISLFSNILKGAGRNPKKGKKKGGIKAHTMVKYEEGIPQMINYTSAATHDHFLLRDVRLPPGSIITFDRAYIDYDEFERLTMEGVTYVTKMKKNLRYDVNDSEIRVNDKGLAVVRISRVRFSKMKTVDGQATEMHHDARLVEYWEEDTGKFVRLLTNDFSLEWEEIREIYRRRWSIEVMFRLLKSNFQLVYFYGDSVNAIEIQIWVTMIAFLLLQVVKSYVKKKWAFSNMVTYVRQCLMYYVDIYRFLENPEGEWLSIVRELESTPSLFDPVIETD